MSAPANITLCPPVDGGRLDSYLVAALATHGAVAAPSRAQVQAWIAAGHVYVDGQVRQAKHRVRAGQHITVHVPAPVAAALAPHAMALDVLYEDGDLLVLNKPAGLSVHPGAGNAEPTLVHGLLAHCTDLSGIGGVVRPGIVHRLDKDTTGVLVVAKHDAAHRHLAAQFAARTTEKRYLALVHDHAALAAGHGRLDTPFGRHARHRQRFSGRTLAPGARVRRAVTDWTCLGRGELADGAGAPLPSPAPAPGRGRRVGVGALAVVGCRLHTGRTHQLRVHLSELGCPIVGDARYGATQARAFAEASEHQPLLRQLHHQALHAWRLGFDHPTTGARLTFTAPLPPTWRQAAQTLMQAAPPGAARDPSKEAPCA